MMAGGGAGAGGGAVAGVCWTVADGLTGPREPTSSMEIRRPDGAMEAGVAGFNTGGFGEVALSPVGRVGRGELIRRFQLFKNPQPMMSWVVQKRRTQGEIVVRGENVVLTAT